MQTGAVVAVTLQAADEGDRLKKRWSRRPAVGSGGGRSRWRGRRAERSGRGQGLSFETTDFAELDVSYVSEPQRGRRKWGGRTRQRDAVYSNRRRIKGKRDKRLMKLRAEKVERSFAHCLHLKGRENAADSRGRVQFIDRDEGQTGRGDAARAGGREEKDKSVGFGACIGVLGGLGALCGALGAVFRRFPAKVRDSAGAPLATPMLLAA